VQAFAISVVMMSSACGQSDSTPHAVQQPLPAAIRTSETLIRPASGIAVSGVQRYDGGHGTFHEPPLSGCRRAASGGR
jgi:hypothetical protein